ncbi:MAG: CBS domain-containing protein [Spirochaetaceae bacterium]|nr:CBS domain-containing protein [Spirochaetaceae bacterium]
MLIRDLLNRKGSDVVTIGEQASSLDVVDLLNDKHIGSLIVTDAKGSILGIVTERDILARFHDAVKGVPVTQIMTPRAKLVVAGQSDNVEYAMSVMTKKRIRHLPVFEGDALIGLVSIGDVMKAVSKDLEFEAKILEEYISGSQSIVS